MSYKSTVGDIYKYTVAPINFFKKNGNQEAALKRAAQYGAAGFSIGGPVGAAVGGGIGYVAGLFEKDPDDILRERRDAMVKNINAERTKRIANIERTTSNQRMTDQQGAGYRAIAAGRDPQNAEDSYLVANQRSAENQNRALENANQVFDAQINEVNAQYESRPVQPSLGDVFLESGMSVAGTMQQEELMQLRKDYLDAYAKNANAKVADGLPKATDVAGDASSTTLNPGVSIDSAPVGATPQQSIMQAPAPVFSSMSNTSNNVGVDAPSASQPNQVQQQTQAVAKAYFPTKMNTDNMLTAPVEPNYELIDKMEVPKDSRNGRMGRIMVGRALGSGDVSSMRNWSR